MPIDPITGSALISGGSQVGNSIISMIGQRRREQRAMNNQIRLMDIQARNQQMLNEHGQRLQLKTWEQTNYPAQVQMLKEAGLNPALLYGIGLS